MIICEVKDCYTPAAVVSECLLKDEEGRVDLLHVELCRPHDEAHVHRKMEGRKIITGEEITYAS